jgi:hypothetical protein
MKENEFIIYIRLLSNEIDLKHGKIHSDIFKLMISLEGIPGNLDQMTIHDFSDRTLS